jgi:geranylgeranyl diphosphate synthase type I
MEDSRIDEIREAGVFLGIAFQLRDDILGLSGDPAVTGKPAGGDIREGKRTLLMWHAWARADEVQRAALKRALGVKTASDEEVSAAIDVAWEVGAFDAVEKEIDAASRRARARITKLDLEDPYAGLLVKIAAEAADRDR